MSFLIRGYIIH